MESNKINSFFKRTHSILSSFKKAYNDKFHSKIYAPIIYGLFFVFATIGVFFLNIFFIGAGKYSFSDIFSTVNHWNDVNWNPNGLSDDDIREIKMGWYNVSATIIAGVGMSLAAIATQSLTRNPIAEGSTLGLVQASIFGVVLAVSMGITNFWEKYFLAMVFGVVAAALLLVFVYFTKKRESNTQKIILAGLAIGVIFKTLTFIFKSGDANSNVVSYSYVLGGAEAISSEPVAMAVNDFRISLIVTGSLVLGALVVAIINIKGMNLLEIGDERAKNLGSSVMLTRILNIVIVLLALPSAVIIVGNMAFLGLFSVHFARWSMRTRNYKKVLPMTIVIGMFLASLGLQLTEHFPKINSGIWMTFIGAPYLIYIGLRGLK